MPPKHKKHSQVRTPGGPRRVFQTSSAPTSPHPGRDRSLEESEGEDGPSDDVMAPLPDIMARLVSCLPTKEPSTSAACSTPRTGPQRAASESPGHTPSPATSTIFDPSPIKPRGGRPRVRNPQRHSHAHNTNISGEAREEMKSNAQSRTKEKTAERRKAKAAEAAEMHRQEAEAKAAEELARKRPKAQEYIEKLTKSEEEGGAGFSSVMEFFETLMMPGWEALASANLTQFFKTNGKEIMDAIIDRVPAIGQEFLDEKFDEKLEQVLRTEGKAIQELLTRGRTTSIMELLSSPWRSLESS
ncbi:hypothetical protein B0H10DRAFT_1954639 [Mycena sp. CBHHK59/15]|nr:hypothetical protein B0H10DRAFT_1954639 [Mycena sp. CBHHK59/15]